MNRPYVICLMTSTINGKCSGRFYQLPEADAARRANAAARDFYDCGAILYGTKTMTESYGTVEDLEPSAERYPRADYLPACETDQFLISIDPRVPLGICEVWFSSDYAEQFCHEYNLRGKHDRNG